MDGRPTITPARYRQLTFWALVSLAAIIVTGAGVRLTGSGLGCSDWPTCEQDQFVADLSFHPLIEFGNRVVTGFVAFAVILAALGALVRRPKRPDLTWWALGLVAGVIAQVVLGMLVTKTELDPRVVIGHFLLSMVLLWNAVILHHRAAAPLRPSSTPGVHPTGLLLRRLSLAAQTVGAALLVAGTVVTGSGPHAGSTEDHPVERLPFDVGEVARLHSAVAYLLLVVVLGLAWVAVKGGAPELRPAVQRVLAIIVAQGALGYLQFALDVPAGLVALHIVGAIALWWNVVLLRQECLAWEAEHHAAPLPQPAAPQPQTQTQP